MVILYFSKIILVFLSVEFVRIFFYVLSRPIGYLLISRFLRKVFICEYINNSVTP